MKHTHLKLADANQFLPGEYMEWYLFWICIKSLYIKRVKKYVHLMEL